MDHRDLLISYGEKFEYALLPVVSGDDMKRIVEACPNALFKLDFSWTTQVEILKLIASQLIEDTCERPHHGPPVGDLQSFSAAWNLCPNVQGLRLWFSDDKNYYRAIFANPKLSLKRLDFDKGRWR